jgi:uncharacterized protein YndB with AHSA1/START domain
MSGQLPERLAPVRRERELGVSAERAFEALTEEIGAWWPLAGHSCSGDPASLLRFEDAQLVETTTSGERHVWGTLLRWEPPHGFVMTWHPGRPDTAPASEVELRVTALAPSRSLVEIFHRGWERLADPLESRTEYENGWPAVMAGLASHLDEEEQPELWHVLAHSPGRRWQPGVHPREQPGIAEHWAFIDRLDARRLLVGGGPLPATPGNGQLVVRGIDTAELAELATTDHESVASGLLTVEVIPWLVVSQPTRVAAAG